MFDILAQRASGWLHVPFVENLNLLLVYRILQTVDFVHVNPTGVVFPPHI